MSTIAEDCTWTAEQILAPHTLGRSLYAQPEVLPAGPDCVYSTNAKFWESVFDDQLVIAERLVQLRNFNIFEWIPRNPGLFHTQQAHSARELAMHHILAADSEPSGAALSASVPIDHAEAFRSATAVKSSSRSLIFTPQGKLSMLQGGVGCIRLNSVESRSGERYSFMCASSSPSPDEGIPLLVPHSIYRKIIDEVRHVGYKRCNAIGRTRFIPAQFRDLYSQSYRIQRLYVQIETEFEPVVSADLVIPEVSVAASFLSEYEGSPKLYAAYVTFNPGQPGARRAATDWMHGEYVRDRYKGEVLTDFDQEDTQKPAALFGLDRVLTSPDLAVHIAALRHKFGYFDWEMLERNSFSFHTHEEHMMVKAVINGDQNKVNISTGQNSPINTGNTTVPRLHDSSLQERHRFIYTLLAWGTGTAFLIALLVISLVWPKPTPPQLRVQASILALAAAGFATVLSGLLNLRLKLGSQLALGATGALAVLVLFYFYNPAVLSSNGQ